MKVHFHCFALSRLDIDSLLMYLHPSVPYCLCTYTNILSPTHIRTVRTNLHYCRESTVPFCVGMLGSMYIRTCVCMYVLTGIWESAPVFYIGKSFIDIYWRYNSTTSFMRLCAIIIICCKYWDCIIFPTRSQGHPGITGVN